MKTFKFTYVAKQYFDVEVEAADLTTAREIFNELVLDDKIDWENPDYLDSDTYVEESEAVCLQP